MIIHNLILSFVRVNRKGGDNNKEFFLLQALDTIKWLKKSGIHLAPGVRVLDLGCGYGEIGGELAKLGCDVTMADDESFVRPEYKHLPFRRFDIAKDTLSDLGQYDVVISSNVLEHLPNREQFLDAAPELIKPGGVLYLSWTNWLSPWGGHEYTPFHYLGPRLGIRLRKALIKTPCFHTLFESLFPTYIGSTIARLRRDSRVRIVRMAPRYYPEFSFLVRLPILREFLTWNCVLLLQRVSTG